MASPVSQKIRAKKLGVLIKDARLESGLSLQDCADRTGLTIEQLEAYESGSDSPSLPHLEVFAYTLEFPIDHFWGYQSFVESREPLVDPAIFSRLYTLRAKMIGVLLKKARLEAGLTSRDLAAAVDIPPQSLESYELGIKDIPLPQLEAIAAHLGLPLTHFMDKDGVVGRWLTQQRSVQQFLGLSPELQAFVSQRVNEPYLAIAQRLSEMSVEKLRSLAEGLLDITL